MRWVIESPVRISYYESMLRAVAVGQRILLAMALGLISSDLPGNAAPIFGPVLTNGEVSIAGLTEVSGVAASRNNANVLWAPNDSGHPAVVHD